jgi:hypothetical protein
MDMRFALDELYSAGWWPAAGSVCLRSADTRWYPPPEQVGLVFRHHGCCLELSQTEGGRCRASWRGRVRGAVIAGCQDEAAVMALAALWRWGASRAPVAVDQASDLRTVETVLEPPAPSSSLVQDVRFSS